MMSVIPLPRQAPALKYAASDCNGAAQPALIPLIKFALFLALRNNVFTQCLLLKNEFKGFP